MNEVFCHHPSLIRGRDRQCPDCGQEIGFFNRPSPPIDNSTLALGMHGSGHDGETQAGYADGTTHAGCCFSPSIPNTSC